MMSVIEEAKKIKNKKQATGGKLAYIMNDSARHTCYGIKKRFEVKTPQDFFCLKKSTAGALAVKY